MPGPVRKYIVLIFERDEHFDFDAASAQNFHKRSFDLIELENFND